MSAHPTTRKVCHPPRTAIVTDLRDGSMHLTLVDVRQTVSIILSAEEARHLFVARSPLIEGPASTQEGRGADKP